MTKASLQSAKAGLVRERVLDGAVEVLMKGRALTFASAAKAAQVPERTVYRYFPTREALLADVFAWANRRIGFDGDLPTDAEGMIALARRAFPGFDGIAPVVRELLSAPEGKAARLSEKKRRQAAAVAVVRHEAPGLDRTRARHVAAAVQLLTTAAAWQMLRDYWDMEGEESAEVSALAIGLLIEGAQKGAARNARAGH